MSAVAEQNKEQTEVPDNGSPLFTIASKPVGTRAGSVITDDLLTALASALEDLGPGQEIVLNSPQYERATKGSAASFAYQLRQKLESRGVTVHGSARASKQGQAKDEAPWYAALSK